MEKKPIFLPSTDAGHPGKSPSAAINAAVPGRTESVPGHNTFSWGDRGPAVFAKVMGKFWPVSLHLLLFSVSLSRSLGSTVPSLYLAAPGGLSHTKVIISLPTWFFRSLFLCNTKATSSSGRETRHRNNAGVSHLLWGKIIQPIHTINHWFSWGWSQQFDGADKHIFNERRCYHLCQQRIFLSI